MNNTFYIVRHGETSWNIEGRTQGHGNSDLTQKGIEQAQCIANRMKDFPIDYIYCSDLGRAVQTGDEIAKTINKNIDYTPNLREMGFGDWEGMLVEDIKTEYGDIYTTWRNEPEKAIIPNGEKLDDIKERLLNYINEINEKHENKHILFVTHSMSVRILLLGLLESDVKNIYKIKQDNTALNIVEMRPYGPVVTRMNDTNHLQGMSLTTNSALE